MGFFQALKALPIVNFLKKKALKMEFKAFFFLTS